MSLRQFFGTAMRCAALRSVWWTLGLMSSRRMIPWEADLTLEL